MYNEDKHVGFHCSHHSAEFHAVETSLRHCCDVRPSSFESEPQSSDSEESSDSMDESTTTTTSEAESPQSE